ncbi:MAG: LacI family DNA-binding transcriptional regulator [Capsulimonadaceae bacterium]|nr:LacI family DNA-binding transcriptional regulator [Capsulimonadaceae bacterium]
MPVSLSDVAAKAEVSVATVSLVLNGKAVGRIPETTRVRVKRAALDLDYHPNRYAKGLQSRQTMNIGVLIQGLRNPYFAEIHEIVEDLICDHGYEVLFDSGRRINFEKGGGVGGWPIDGILAWATSYQRINSSSSESSNNIPVVYVGSPRTDGTDFVTHNAEQGTLLALDYLWEQGYRRIGFSAPPNIEYPAREFRREAYLKFCEDRSLRPDLVDVTPMLEMRNRYQSGYRQAGYEAGCRLASIPANSRPQAVLCYNDLIGIGMMNGALSEGLRIPEDVAIVGFDGIDEGKYQIRPLTTVVTPVDKTCSLALDILLGRISGNLEEAAQGIVLPMTLRIGKSA